MYFEYQLLLEKEDGEVFVAHMIVGAETEAEAQYAAKQDQLALGYIIRDIKYTGTAKTMQELIKPICKLKDLLMQYQSIGG